MHHVLAVALGGALGAVSRYLVYLGASRLFGVFFPLGTLIVNVLGSFAIGFLSLYFLNRVSSNSFSNVFLMVGVLGGFTTFSSFSIETLQLFHSHHIGYAALNVGLNVGLSLISVALGAFIASSVTT